LSFAAAREYEEKAIFWKDQANVTCYNVSANLCDCWGDGYTRTDKHFKKGLDLVEKAIELRKELKKPDGPFAMAYWAKGKHLLSLKNYIDAEKNFALALDYEKKLAQKEQKPTQLVEDAPASLLNAAGFLGLAQDRKGTLQGKAMFTTALGLLESKVKKADSNLKDDIQLYVDQLKISEKVN
jgi:tetratricopeptide (TPR) repeat protein